MDVELPSSVDDMCMDIVDWEGKGNMQAIEGNVERIDCKVAEQCNLPLETDKEEVLHLRKRATQIGNMSNGWGSYSMTFWVLACTESPALRKPGEQESVGGLKREWGHLHGVCWKKAYEGTEGMVRTIKTWGGVGEKRIPSSEESNPGKPRDIG